MKASLKQLLTASLLISTASAGAQGFVTDGDGIRNAIRAEINGQEMLYISEIDGAVALYNLIGEKQWSDRTKSNAISFEILAKDITGDNNDDLILANADGIYAWDSAGKLLWVFDSGTKVRMNDVAVVGSGRDAKIYAGGSSLQLYELDADGHELSRTPIKGTIRALASGNFIDKEKEILFMHTLEHDKFRSEFFGYIDPVTKNVIAECDLSDIAKNTTGAGKGIMVTDYSVVDIDLDGRDDMLYAGAISAGVCFAFNGELKPIFTYSAPVEDAQRYAHATAVSLQPFRNVVVMQFGGVLYHIAANGDLISKSGAPHRGVIYNDLVCCASTNTLFGAGQIGGDNTMYSYDLTNPQWYNETQEFDGRAKEVNDNITTLYNQALEFQLPAYQKKSDKPYVVTVSAKSIAKHGDDMILGLQSPNANFIDDNVAILDGGSLEMVTQYIVTEDYDRSSYEPFMGTSADRRDPRKAYNLTHQQIVDWAAAQERRGDNFAIWAGHGGDPLYMDTKTLERIIEVAPNTCKSLIYAEMANTSDPRVIFFVDEVMPRIAKAIRDNNSATKIQFRYKGMFWAADSHKDLWRKFFFSNQYSDILVPSAEDTNNRVQEINLAGRVGMFMSGYVDDYSIRLVDDNPTSWRPCSPGGQRSVSPYLRHAALLAGYGARYGLFYDIQYFEKPGFNAFYALVKSGILPVVEREDILSVGTWFSVDNFENIDLESIASGGHNLTQYTPADLDGVVANASLAWCGASIMDNDYSSLLGAEYRWLNFIPTLPYGMIPITDGDYEPQLKKMKAKYVTSNFEQGFIKGKAVDNKLFGEYMRETAEKGAQKLIMRVEGASWTLVKIDDHHARLCLIDQGYVDPQARDAKVIFQGESPVTGVDILTGEKFETSNGDILNITVPAGSMRFIDFEYSSSIEKLRK